MPDRLTTHRCKGCGAVLALIDPRARRERFALWCSDCGRHLVIRPEVCVQSAPVLEQKRDVSAVL